MTQFLDSNSGLAVREAAQNLRDWQRDRAGLGVALVYGPVSAEDRLYHSKCPVDQRSVTALSEALDDIGARWKILNPCEADFIMELAGYDVALSNLHGPYGEDGRLQGLLDYLRVPYCGSGVAASAVATEATEAEFYDADTKLDVDSRGAVAVRAAELPPEVLAKVTAYATTLWDGLGLRGSARVDVILAEDDQPYVLEVNSTPGMSRDSNFVVGAAMVGLTHTDVVVAMLHEALARPPYDVPQPTPPFAGTTPAREAAVSP